MAWITGLDRPTVVMLHDALPSYPVEELRRVPDSRKVGLLPGTPESHMPQPDQQPGPSCTEPAECPIHISLPTRCP